MNEVLSASAPPTRPILRYHGGKWRLAPQIISHFPAHRIYVEPFGGAGSVLLRKERCYAEVYNDLDGEIVNLFRVVRTMGDTLREQLTLTPYSREEYRLSFEPCGTPLEQARRTVVRSYMGFGSNSLCRTVKSGFRANSNRSGTTPAHDWQAFPTTLARIILRLQGVTIEQRPALEVIAQQDSAETLHYVDPPYVHSSRSASAALKGYTHEMSDEEHRALAKVLRAVVGKVVLSGYDTPLYHSLYADWRQVRIAARADGARARTEVLWMNFAEDPNVNLFPR